MSSSLGPLLPLFPLRTVVPAESAPAGLSGSPLKRRRSDRSAFERRLFVVLAAVALIYAFLAGLRTLKDYDLGWQLATGRWVAQHHLVPSVDVFSYTVAGTPWIYPVGSGMVFYGLYLLGGYALLSWLGATACCATAALLLRRGSAVTAAIAIIAVPLLAWRTAPRSDLFTVVLFAAFLSLLWENYQTGQARLWLLPLLMIGWVNLHLGFAAGLGLLVMYAVTELLEWLAGPERRIAAMERLRRASPWLLLTFVATLVNPWGWNIYLALIRQERVSAQHQAFFLEWKSVPLSWNAVSNTMSFRQTLGAIYLLLAIAVVAGAIAIFRDRLGAGILLLGATVPAVRYVRMGAVFACIAVLIGGYVLSAEVPRLAASLKQAKLRQALAITFAAFFIAMASLRCFDLVTNRYYLGNVEESTFGAGLGWWFPQRAAEFIQREGLPGEVFNTYTEGGYVTWRLGPERRDYIDGRGIPFGVERIERETQLRQSAPDSALWTDEANRYNINTLILPVARYQGIQFLRLLDFCNSRNWAPVYLDEVSAVFVRRTPENAPVIQRFPVNCATAPLPAQPPTGTSAAAFNAWANAAPVLAALGRNPEALLATEKALAIFPNSAFLHWLRARLLSAEGRLDESEQEYLRAIAIHPDAVTWSSLAESYRKRGLFTAAEDADQHAAQYATKP
jgi:tetratricopeptide (TPR) repeat protein